MRIRYPSQDTLDRAMRIGAKKLMAVANGKTGENSLLLAEFHKMDALGHVRTFGDFKTPQNHEEMKGFSRVEEARMNFRIHALMDAALVEWRRE